MDDALSSVPSTSEAVDILTKTKVALMSVGKIRQEKIASNSVEVMGKLPPVDLSKELKNPDMNTDDLSMQRSLGLKWDFDTDTFTFRVSLKETPFTRRGVPATVSSLCFPFGLIAPVKIQRKLILRNLISATMGWDEPL